MSPPAARVTDPHSCPKKRGERHVGGPILPDGEPTVLIGNRPAARVGDHAACQGPPDKIETGEETVLIGKRFAARRGDWTEHGGRISSGFKSVLIGKDPPEIDCIRGANASGTPFVRGSDDE